MKLLNIIQCRSDSTRLPGKCFLKFGELTMIQRIYSIVRNYDFNNEHNTITTVVAIPDNDEKLYNHLWCNKIPVYVGNPKNVLNRFYSCADYYGVDLIGRITGDCPCPAIYISSMMAQMMVDKGIDYLSNFRSNKRRIVDGEDYEIISMKLLKFLNDNVTSDQDKEHVTSYIHDNNNDDKLKEFRRMSINHNYDYSYIKTSIDTMEDYERVLKHVII